MTSLTEIEAAIAQLPKSDARQLVVWLQNYLDEDWDRQLEADVKSGRLEPLIHKAEDDITAI